ADDVVACSDRLLQRNGRHVDLSDIGGEGNIVVFNGFYGVTPCAIRYEQLVNVVKYFPKVKILQPELREVIPNTVQDA
ncbi:hypothetical protein ACC756_39340, partial [Rhizobium ruizarguesonis]